VTSEHSNLKTAFFLNFAFTLLEIAGGLWTNSVAILSDALHDLGDTVALGASWYLAKVSQKQRDDKFSYGYKRFSLLGALISSLILLGGSGIILVEAVPRLVNPQAVYVPGMIALAIVGILVNGFAVLKLQGAHTHNERIVALHLLEDTLGWVVVLIASVTMLVVNIPILDPILSIAITLYILWQVVKNLRETIAVFLQAIPTDIDTQQLEKILVEKYPVHSIHDLHIWTLDGAYNVLSLHIVVTKNLSVEDTMFFKKQVRQTLHEYGIQHVTIEIEYPEENCELVDC
jgi:cobalt-zinc-cadmium efflux system protein